MQAVVILLLSVLFVQSPLTVLAESATPDTPVPTEETESALPQATAAATAPNPQRHDPTTGIYDGAVYRLRNVAHGTYMDVDNEETDSGTNISTYQFNGKLNQQFRFRYLGKGLYELIPMNSPENYVRVAEFSDDANIEIYGSSSTQTRFKIVALSNGAYVLYSQSSNFTNAICFDTTNPNNVIQRNYANYPQKGLAQWYLESVDDSIYDAYTKYYIRNVRTGLYLDVEQGSTECGAITQARLLIGVENAQWRQVYDEETEAYMIVPMHYTYSKLTLNSTGNLTICSYRSDSTQRFRLEAVGTDPCGRPTYRVKTSCSGYTGYLNIGERMGNDSNFYYVKSGTDADDLWVFEQVLFDDPEVNCFYTNSNQALSISWERKTIVRTFQTAGLSRYKLEMSFSTEPTVLIYDNVSLTHPYYQQTISSTSTQKVIDMCLLPNRTYYFVIQSSANTDTLQMRLRQFTATYHSNNRGDLTAEQGILAILDSSAEAGWYVTNKPGMTVSRAKQETNALTGYRDFDSEIFVYSGHGNPGFLYYEQKGSLSTDPYFWADYLPDMSHCELVVWAACRSAQESTGLGMSMVSQSIAMGAKTAIGWSDSIGDFSTNTYLDNLFTALAFGNTVYLASQRAIEVSNFTLVNAIVTSLVLAGDTGNCLIPRHTMYLVAPADKSQAMEYNAIDASRYTLVAENESCGVKLYTRMLNGIPTDDFYLEYYDERGTFTGIWKSPYTLNDETIMRFETEQATFISKKTMAEKENWLYSYIKGVWQLVTYHESGEYSAVFVETLEGGFLQ